MGGPHDRPASFPKAARIRKRSDFVHARERGRSFSDGPLAVSWTRREPEPTRRCGDPASCSVARVGLVVSSKVGNSVVRSRVKRRLREAVLVARDSAVQSGTDLLGLCLDRICRRIAGSLRTADTSPLGQDPGS
jgi:ribonuclease P protein component